MGLRLLGVASQVPSPSKLRMNQVSPSSTTRPAHLVAAVHLQGVGVLAVAPHPTAPVLLKEIPAVGSLPIVVRDSGVRGGGGEIGRRSALSMLLSEYDVQSRPRTIERASRRWLLIPAGRCWKRSNSIASPSSDLKSMNPRNCNLLFFLIHLSP